MNYYDFLNESCTRETIITAIKEFWQTYIQGKWVSGGDCKWSWLCFTFLAYQHVDTFDILLTRDLSRGHIIDFNPYVPNTDPLLFTYEDLLVLLTQNRSWTPQLKVIDSRTHPAATRNAPAHQHNMIPFEALSLSSGRDIEAFSGLLQEEIKHAIDE